MSHKHNIEEIVELFEKNGIAETIDDLPSSKIDDNQLSELWQHARHFLQAINEYIEDHREIDIDIEGDEENEMPDGLNEWLS